MGLSVGQAGLGIGLLRGLSRLLRRYVGLVGRRLAGRLAIVVVGDEEQHGHHQHYQDDASDDDERTVVAVPFGRNDVRRGIEIGVAHSRVLGRGSLIEVPI